ncbi:DgyrCDS14879 [Dimorphilus gyrociliatus]|uniref:DgyrCDS14879 n=1 Tax=Dimorphilus gyrociliatus TaxID=2664684 RepID=A0A7I8WF71_9ANNE|nr:DgyrCDS14879 [Dimorphilus gyrociliatus]
MCIGIWRKLDGQDYAFYKVHNLCTRSNGGLGDETVQIDNPPYVHENDVIGFDFEFGTKVPISTTNISVGVLEMYKSYEVDKYSIDLPSATIVNVTAPSVNRYFAFNFCLVKSMETDNNPLCNSGNSSIIVGHDVIDRGGSGAAFLNMYTNFGFPCKGYLSSITYYRINPTDTGEVGIWRKLENGNKYNLTYQLIYLIQIPQETAGIKTIHFNDIINVQPDDTIAFHPTQNGSQFISFQGKCLLCKSMAVRPFQNYYPLGHIIHLEEELMLRKKIFSIQFYIDIEKNHPGNISLFEISSPVSPEHVEMVGEDIRNSSIDSLYQIMSYVKMDELYKVIWGAFIKDCRTILSDSSVEERRKKFDLIIIDQYFFCRYSQAVIPGPVWWVLTFLSSLTDKMTIVDRMKNIIYNISLSFVLDNLDRILEDKKVDMEISPGEHISEIRKRCPTIP